MLDQVGSILRNHLHFTWQNSWCCIPAVHVWVTMDTTLINRPSFIVSPSTSWHAWFLLWDWRDAGWSAMIREYGTRVALSCMTRTRFSALLIYLYTKTYKYLNLVKQIGPQMAYTRHNVSQYSDHFQMVRGSFSSCATPWGAGKVLGRTCKQNMLPVQTVRSWCLSEHGHHWKMPWGDLPLPEKYRWMDRQALLIIECRRHWPDATIWKPDSCSKET